MSYRFISSIKANRDDVEKRCKAAGGKTVLSEGALLDVHRLVPKEGSAKELDEVFSRTVYSFEVDAEALNDDEVAVDRENGDVYIVDSDVKP